MSKRGGDASYRLNGVPVGSEQFYAVACDPRRSVAVQACAGAGKTWMLVSRIVRALLDGAAAHEILAITFTKKAAGEMRQRLNDWLQLFAQAGPEKLQQELRVRGVAQEQVLALCEPLRQLHAQLLAHRRPVQIRTFHSWFAALLRNAPLSVLDELGLPAAYELLEDDSVAVAQVWRPFQARVLQDAQARASYQAVVTRHGRFAMQQALTSALQRRLEFALADARGVVQRSVPHFAKRVAGYADLAHPMLRWRDGTVRARWLACAAALGAEKGQTAPKAAQAVMAAYELLDAVRPDDAAAESALQAAFVKLRSGFFVADEDRITQHLLKFSVAMAVEAELRQLCEAMRQHQAWTYQQHMAVLTRLLVQEYAGLKRERGWVDMADVESAAGRLLGDPALGAWVQERLDARTRHLLIDEFQDTNPLQWQALHAWLSAYAGSGGGPERPSLFIVGDPKQSIYRFRRAEPQVFLAAQAFVRELGGDLAECDHTRRNAPAVLTEVNRCMGEAQAAGAFVGFREHSTASTEAGGVFVLPQIARAAKSGKREAGAGQPPWRDSLLTPRITPEETLRTLECRQAAQWVARQLHSGVPAGEILVLARKRDRLSAMQDELRDLGVPALQPEKLDLGEAPEVQDMVALLDALVSPAHNLSLARALKSPLFGLGDDDLVQLALHQRAHGGNWLDLLLRPEGLPEHLQSAGRTLARWQEWVQTLPPHDALDAIFTDGDVLARFVAQAAPAQRAGVLAHLQAVLWAALQLDGARYATPYALVRALRTGPVHAPSIADANAVRLLTVHGAKGLEARAVLVLDADAPPPKAQTMGVLIDWPGEAPAPLAFVFLASESVVAPSAVHAVEVEQTARGREELNALYVAMTRARQCLLLSSVQPATAQASSWWQRLLPGCVQTTADTPWPFALAEEKAGASGVGATPYPDSTHLVLAGLPALTAFPADQQVRSPLEVDPRTEPDADRSAIGQAMHRLLEWAACGQTAFVPRQVLAVAREFALDSTQAAQAAAMAERILNGLGAWVWQADMLAWQGNEVSLLSAGASLRLDRLVRRADTGHWWVLDHKSAARPEADPLLVAQLAQYRSAVQAVYPGDVVRAAFLTAQGELKEIE